MTPLVTMSSTAPDISAPMAALAFYPGCGKQALLHLFAGAADEEVSPPRCQK
jgi:hypothetical protein